MEIGRLVYKCRKCNGLDKSRSIPNIKEALVCLTLAQSVDCGVTSIELLKVHFCEDGELGISDLIGAERDK